MPAGQDLALLGPTYFDQSQQTLGKSVAQCSPMAPALSQSGQRTLRLYKKVIRMRDHLVDSRSSLSILRENHENKQRQILQSQRTFRDAATQFIESARVLNLDQTLLTTLEAVRQEHWIAS